MTNDTPHAALSEADPRFFRAMQYVLDELSDAEREAFETVLPEDPALCAAVAQATQLLAGVQAALKSGASGMLVAPSHAEFPKKDRWTAAAVAAIATGIAATLLATFSTPKPSSHAVELVSLWRDAGLVEVAASSAESVFETDSAPVNEDGVPPWMLAAVSLEHRPSRSPLSEPTKPWEDN